MDRQYVGIDLHRRRSVIVRTDSAGEVLGEVRIENDPLRLAAEIAKDSGGKYYVTAFPPYPLVCTNAVSGQAGCAIFLYLTNPNRCDKKRYAIKRKNK